MQYIDFWPLAQITRHRTAHKGMWKLLPTFMFWNILALIVLDMGIDGFPIKKEAVNIGHLSIPYGQFLYGVFSCESC